MFFFWCARAKYLTPKMSASNMFFMADGLVQLNWILLLRNGGKETLESFLTTNLNGIPSECI